MHRKTLTALVAIASALVMAGSGAAYWPDEPSGFGCAYPVIIGPDGKCVPAPPPNRWPCGQVC